MTLQVTREQHDVQVLGQRFQYVGRMEPIGRAMDYFNDASRTTFTIYDVEVFPLGSKGPLKTISRPQIVANSSELGLIYFLDSEYREQVNVLRNFDRVIVYTPHAILRGNFHRGAETSLAELFDMLQGSFLAMTEVSVFPLVQLPTLFPQQADLLVVNRSFVSLYHPEE
jgi:hypothetical protein